VKLVLCTLAVCLSILVSVLTLSSVIRTEEKKTRSTVPKALAEQLDAVNAQLAGLSRRLSVLEERETGRPPQPVPAGATAETLQTDIRSLAKGVTSAQTRLEGVSTHLAELTTYLDRSFDHLEKALPAADANQGLQATVNQMAGKIDAIDSYFTPLYTFLGLVYDPKANDILSTYPSMDERINELSQQIETLRKELADLRYMLTPRNIEPTKHPR